MVKILRKCHENLEKIKRLTFLKLVFSLAKIRHFVIIAFKLLKWNSNSSMQY